MRLSLPAHEIEPVRLPFDFDAGPARAFVRAFQRMNLPRAAPRFRVEFHPFAGLRSTIRFDGDAAEVRISDLLAQAPPLVLEALAEILLAQIFRRRASREARECYAAYISRPPMRGRINAARRRRGFKRLLPPQGQFFDLAEIFERLSRRYFRNRLSTPVLGWSVKRSRSILGHYDAAHHTISISRWLDSPAVPRYLVEYLVFHEMLHMRFPEGRRGHRRVIHSREFREAEKEFPKFEQARRRLKLICA